MFATATTEINLTLKLSLAEANWLHAKMQNPDSSLESTEDYEMREKFFAVTDMARHKMIDA